MGLVFKQFKLAVPYLFTWRKGNPSRRVTFPPCKDGLGKEEPPPIFAIYGTIICGNTFLKGQIHEKSEKYTHLGPDYMVSFSPG